MISIMSRVRIPRFEPMGLPSGMTAGPCVLAVAREHGVGVDVRKHDHAELSALLHGLQRLDGVGQQVARVGMHLDLDPVVARGLPELRDPHRLRRVARAGRVEHHLDLRAVDDAQDVVMLRVAFVDARERSRHEFSSARRKRAFEHFARGELASSEKKAALELSAADNQVFHFYPSSAGITRFRFAGLISADAAPCDAAPRYKDIVSKIRSGVSPFEDQST
jgi:hypothetical protein